METDEFEWILVPLDGSDFAEQALEPAVAIARRGGGSLHLVSVCDPAVAGAELVEVELSLEGEVGAYLERVAGELGDDGELDVETSVLTGRPAGALVEEARRSAADLVVLATHGRGPLSRLWLGSVADEVTRESPCPVLLVRAVGEGGRATVPFRPDHVLAPVDPSEVNEPAVEHAAHLARLFDARLTLFAAVWFPEYVSTPYLPHVEYRDRVRILVDVASRARERLEELADRLGSTTLAVDVRIAEDRHPAEAVLECVGDEEIDAVVMGTHGRGGVPRLVLGSVADKVVRASPAPVLLVRP